MCACVCVGCLRVPDFFVDVTGNRKKDSKKKRGVDRDNVFSPSESSSDDEDDEPMMESTDEDRNFIDAEIPSEEERDEPSLAVFVGKNFSRSSHGDSREKKKAKISKATSSNSKNKGDSGPSCDKHGHPNTHSNVRPRYACQHFACATVREADLASPCSKCIAKNAGTHASSSSSHKSIAAPDNSNGNKPKSSYPSACAASPASSSSSRYAKLSFTSSSGKSLHATKNDRANFEEGMEHRVAELMSYARSFSADHDACMKAMQDKLSAKDSEMAKAKEDSAKAIGAMEASLATMRKRAQDAECEVARVKAQLGGKVLVHIYTRPFFDV
jgi:hypothetical protein